METKPPGGGSPARAARRRKGASSSFLEDRGGGLRLHSPPLQGPGAACLALHLTPASERGGASILVPFPSPRGEGWPKAGAGRILRINTLSVPGGSLGDRGQRSQDEPQPRDQREQDDQR